jgi:hypothetical protein
VFLHREKTGLTGMGRTDRIGKERFPCAAADRGQTQNPKCKIRNTKHEIRNKAKKRRKQEENLDKILRNRRKNRGVVREIVNQKESESCESCESCLSLFKRFSLSGEKNELTGIDRMNRIERERFLCAAAGRAQTQNPSCLREVG